MINPKRYSPILLGKIKIEEESPADAETTVRNNQQVGFDFPLFTIISQSSSGNSINRAEILEDTQTKRDSLFVRNIGQKFKTEFEIPDLNVKIKKDNQSVDGITYELVDCIGGCISGNYKLEPESPEFLQVCETDQESREEKSNFGGNEEALKAGTSLASAVSGQTANKNNEQFSSRIELDSRNGSSYIKLTYCWVRLTDLFSNEERRLGKAHSNAEFCSCMYCCREYNPMSPKKGSKSQEDSDYERQKDECAVNESSQCNENPVSVGWKSDFMVHRKVHNCQSPHSCEDCSGVLKQENLLKWDLRSRRGGTKHEFHLKNSKPVPSSLTNTSILHGFERTFKCNQCSATFKFEPSLVFHLEKHGDKAECVECKQCSTRFKCNSSLKKHIISCHPNKRPYKCEECQATFKLLDSLRIHAQEHSNKKPYCYELCPTKFKRRDNLNQHLSMQHTSEKPHKCSLCPAMFKLPCLLKQHLQIHRSVKPYSCPHCSARFKTKLGMKLHVLGHSSKKPFKCEVCAKTFTDQFRLRLHLIIHREKLFECELCQTKFKVKSQLKTHLKIHSYEELYTCDHCFASFKTKGNLSNHVVTHNDARPFECWLCPATFKRSSTLKKHLKTHCEDSDFTCAHCLAKFVTKNSLKSHTNKWHGADKDH